MQDGPRGYILCHPASYTALTRTKLVPAGEAGVLSLIPPCKAMAFGGFCAADVMQLYEVAKVSLQIGNQQLILVFFLS